MPRSFLGQVFIASFFYLSLFCSPGWALPPDKLIEHLNDEDPQVRKAAEDGLLAAAYPCTLEFRTLLIEVLDDPNPYIRTVAVKTLSRCAKQPELSSHFIRMLDDPDPLVQSAAISAFWSFKADEALPKLLEIAQHGADTPKRTAASLLVNLKTPKTLPFLKTVLQAGSDHKYQAISRIAEIGTPEARSVLIDALSQQDPGVRAWVIITLAQHNVKSALPNIQKLKSDPNPRVRNAALKALAILGDKEIISEVLPLLEDPQPYTQKTAIDMLQQLKSKEAVPSLLKVAASTKDPLVRNRALTAVKAIAPEDPRLITTALKLTEDKDNGIRLTAFSILEGKSMTPAVVKAIERGLSDSSESVRNSAAKSVSMVPDLNKLPSSLVSSAMDIPGLQREFAARLLHSGPKGIQLLVSKVVTTGATDLKQWIFAFNKFEQAIQDEVFRATIPWLKSPERDIRKEALTILEFSRTTNPLAIEGLAIAAKDSDPAIRIEAAYALQAIDTPVAIEASRTSGAGETVRDASARISADIEESMTKVLKLREEEDLKPEISSFEFHSLYEWTDYKDGFEFTFTVSPNDRWLMFFGKELSEENEKYRFNPPMVVIDVTNKTKHVLSTVNTVKDVIFRVGESSWSKDSKFFVVSDHNSRTPTLILDVDGLEPKLVEHQYLNAEEKRKYLTIRDTLSCSDCYDRSKEDNLFKQYIAEEDFYPASLQPSYAYNIMSSNGQKLFFLKGRGREANVKSALAMFDIPTKSETLLYQFPLRPAVGGGSECVRVSRMRLSPNEKYLFYLLDYGCGGIFSNGKQAAYIFDLEARTPHFVSSRTNQTAHWTSDSKRLFYIERSKTKTQGPPLRKIGYINFAN